MGKYAKTINKLIKAIELKTGVTLLLNREEFFSKKLDKKINVIVLNNSKKKKIFSSASEIKFLKYLANIFKLDKKELINILHPKQKDDKAGGDKL